MVPYDHRQIDRGCWVVLYVLCTMCAGMIVPGSGYAGKEIPADHLYVTWQGLEPDKCASAWFIKRFLDPEAVFVLLAPGTTPGQGTPFDIPAARFRTTHRSTTFDSIYEQVAEKNGQLERMRKIIRDLEFNKWEPPTTPESKGLQVILEGIRKSQGETEPALGSAIKLFDWLYAGLK